jgi:hypothetical protein
MRNQVDGVEQGTVFMTLTHPNHGKSKLHFSAGPPLGSQFHSPVDLPETSKLSSVHRKQSLTQ